ncbi:MAG: ECF transporter S component [Clostridiales bacterium]|nr:ECF transporter S component [Clostridiales bacterium]
MSRKTRTTEVTFAAMMIALVFVSNYISIPTGYSRLHVANAICLLAGMLFGGLKGALIAGLGSALFDLTFPAYAPEAWITFINKGAMALVCGIIVHDKGNKLNPHALRVVAAVTGALLYMVLYMIKSYIQIRWITPIPADVIPVTLIGKLASSSLNALFAVIAAPILYASLYPALKQAGIWKN